MTVKSEKLAREHCPLFSSSPKYGSKIVGDLDVYSWEIVVKS